MTTGTESRSRTIITASLLVLWLILIAFGIVSHFEPEWLKDLARTGTKVESQTQMDQGSVYLRSGEYPQAIASFQKALEIQPDNIEAKLNQAIAYARYGQLDLGIRVLEGALGTHTTQKGTIHYKLAGLFEQQEKWDESIRHYEEALDLGVNPAFVYQKLGTVFVGRQEYGKAREAYENSLVWLADVTLPHRNMLQTSLALYEDDAENLRIIEELVAADVDEEDLTRYDLEIIRRVGRGSTAVARVHSLLGFVCANLEDYEAAIEHFETSLAIRPGDREAEKNLETLRKFVDYEGTGDHPPQ